jgi:hypothetical protein
MTLHPVNMNYARRVKSLSCKVKYEYANIFRSGYQK